MKNLIQSNPKPLEEYSKMFNLVYEVADEIQNLVEKEMGNRELSKNLLIHAYEQTLQVVGHIFYGQNTVEKNPRLSEELKYFIETKFLNDFILSIFTKNNQIEQIIKIMRVMISRNIYLVAYSIDTDAKSTPEWLEKKILEEDNQHWVSKSSKLKSLLDKLYTRYFHIDHVSPNLKVLNLLKAFRNDVIPRFVHIKSVLNNNPKFIKDFNELDFIGLRVSEFKDVLDELERKIEESKDSSLVYEGKEEEQYQKLLQRESKVTSLYMKVDDEYSWYLIKAPQSAMEAFLGSKGSGTGTHCGTPSSQESCLFSLRSLNEKGQFILHATCSAHEYDADDQGKLYCLVEMRTRRNHAIPPKLWPYMYALYTSDEIVSETSPSYSSENSFLSDWFHDLPDFFKYSEKEKTMFKKMHNEIVTKKPYLKSFKKAVFNLAPEKIIYKYVDYVMFNDFKMREYIANKLIEEMGKFFNIEHQLSKLSKFIDINLLVSIDDIKILILTKDSNEFVKTITDDFYKFSQNKLEGEEISSITEKIKSKIKSKKMSKKHLVKIMENILEISDKVAVLKLDSMESLKSVSKNTFNDDMLEWVISKASDAYNEASQYVDDNVDLRIFPENHKQEHDTNLKEILDYLQLFEERTNLQVYSPIVEEYSQTEMILTIDEFLFEKLRDRNKEGFYETLDDCLSRAYRDQMTSSCESVINESCFKALDGHICYSEDSENEILEFKANWNDGSVEVILRMDDSNIEDITGDDENDIFINGLPKLKPSKDRDFNIDYYAEFNFENFIELLHDDLWDEFK